METTTLAPAWAEILVALLSLGLVVALLAMVVVLVVLIARSRR